MKTAHLILTFFGVTKAAHSGLYANINGSKEALYHLPRPELEYLVLRESQDPVGPKLSMDAGVISTGEGKDKKVFGVTKGGFLGFGTLKQVKPAKLNLDMEYKVLKINPYFCKWSHSSKNRGIFLSNHYSSRHVTCSPVDLYLLHGFHVPKREIVYLPGEEDFDDHDQEKNDEVSALTERNNFMEDLENEDFENWSDQDWLNFSILSNLES